MPIDYTDGENTELTAEINKQQPYPAGFINMDAPVDAMGERYRVITEFDLSSEAAYDSMLEKYPDAWKTYYDEDAPEYSEENALKLQEAIKFYLYISDGETANVEIYESGGIISIDGVALSDAPAMPSPYASQGGAYENPNAFHDREVYDTVTNGGVNPLPTVTLNSEVTISSRTTDKAHLAEMYSEEQLAMKEYETTKAAPKSPYDWGGPYATGKNTY